jgi:hypothetical protein
VASRHVRASLDASAAVLASGLAVALSLCEGAVAAAPQASAGMTFGGVVEGVNTDSIHGQVHWGGRGDVLFLRSRGSDMAIGPYVDIATSSFHDVDMGGGLEWLLPVRDDLPFVLSGGVFARDGEGRRWAPGVEGTVFWGSRSYNYHSWYGLAAGLFAQSRYVPSDPEQADLVFGIQIDGEILLMPSMLILQLFRTDAR